MLLSGNPWAVIGQLVAVAVGIVLSLVILVVVLRLFAGKTDKHK